MMNENTTIEKQVVIIKANHALSQKVGRGKIAPKVIIACQQVIETNAYDFKPLADDLLKSLEKIIKKTSKSKKDNQQELINELAVIIMQIKANAGIFHFQLISDIADTVLDLIEEVSTLDENILELVQTFHTTVNVLIEKGIKGRGSQRAKKIHNEFSQACTRYRSLGKNK